MKILTWNVNGGVKLAANTASTTFLNTSGADVICLQEIRTNNTIVHECLKHALSNYPFVYFKPAAQAGCSGLAVFAKVTPRRVVRGTFFRDEGRFLMLVYEECNIITVYVPNSGRDFVNQSRRLEWEDVFRAFVRHVSRDKPLIVVGDLNVAPEKIDRLRVDATWAGCSAWEAAAFYDLLATGNLVDAYRQLHSDAGFTWGLHASKLRLDYVLASREIVPVSATVYRITQSDHFPLVVDLVLPARD